MSEQSRFDFQKLMFEKGAEELQRHIGRLDEILYKTRAGGVTVWVALLGWSFSAKNEDVIPLGWVVIIGFWLLEGFFKGIQTRYFDRSRVLTEFLNDRDAMDRSFESHQFPPGIVYPISPRESEFGKLYMYVRGLAHPSVCTTYLFLGFINYLVWLAVRNG